MSNLKSLVEKELGSPITDDEMKKAEQYARRKLDWIVRREGDAQGERLKPWYLVLLIAETVSQDRFSQACLKHCKAIAEIQLDTKIDCAAL